MSEPGAASVVRPVIAPLHGLLYAASTLVFLAGLQLTVFTDQTDTYFAWTIHPPLTAAFLGAAYWAAVPVELIAARETVWAKARVAVPAIWLFTTLTLVATLVHFDRFHFSSPIASAQGRHGSGSRFTPAFPWRCCSSDGSRFARREAIRREGPPRPPGCGSWSSAKGAARPSSAQGSSSSRPPSHL